MTIALHRRAALAGLATTIVPLSAARSATADGVTLVARPRTTKLSTKAEAAADLWTLEGEMAGPVLRMRHGEPLVATLRNETPKPLSLHWHGVRGLAAMDGVGGLSQPPVAPGQSFTWRFTPPDAGTFLVRPLVIGGASEAAGRGIGGLLIVDEKTAPGFDQDVAILVRDWLLTPTGALAPFGDVQSAASGGRLGNLMTAGSDEAPKRLEVAPGTRLRLRLANGCSARLMRIRFDGAKAFVGAIDGQPTETFEPLRASLPFGPGSRYDIFLDAPAEAGAKASIVALVGPGIPLVEIVASTAKPVSRGPIASLPLNAALPPEIRLQNAVRATMTLTGGASRGDAGTYTGDTKVVWRVNGAAGAPSSPPLLVAKRGQPVVLAIANQTGFVQPIHLHGHVFRLLHALDDGWEPYWLDTLQAAEAKTTHISFLADNPGRWAITSSVMERFDTGLWSWFEVT